MTITLSDDAAAYVRDKLAAGEFATADEAVAQAIRLMRQVEADRPAADDELRREIEAGLADVDAGRVAAWDAEETKRRLLERLAKRAAS